MESIIVEAKIGSKSIKKIAEMAVSIMEEKMNIPKEKKEKLAYTLNELEDMYGINSQTLARHIRDGLLKSNKPGKSHVVLKKDFLIYLNANSNE